MRLCPDCRIPLEPWSPSVFLYFCPCCSSRFDPRSMDFVHFGSHNDYATYRCDLVPPSPTSTQRPGN